MKTFFFCY